MKEKKLQPNKILIIQTAFIGDVILATSLIEKVHAHFPNAQLDFLLRKGNESLLKDHPYIHKTIIWDKQGGKYRNMWKLLGNVRKEQYDWIINIQRHATMGFFTAFSNANYKIGFDKNPFSFGFHKKVKHSFDGIHEVERNTALIADATDATSLKPKLYPSKTDFEKVEQYKKEPFITISPTTVWFTKQFPIHKWKQFVNQANFTGNIYLLGAPSDKELCQKLLEEIGHKNVFNLAGSTTLLQSAALMKDAVLNFMNDSAPMHLASSQNANTCAIYCSTAPSLGYGPLSDFAEIVEVKEKLSCRPCGIHGKKECPLSHFDCGNQITTQQLLNVLQRALNH